MIRIGFVCSSGGSVAAAALRILSEVGYPVEAAVVTDRPCGAEDMAQKIGVPLRRIPFVSRLQFSQEAANWLFDDMGMDWSCLLFLRLVSSELFDRAPCFNLHPSLLPAFAGFGALQRVLSAGVQLFGATAHQVDDSVDGGPIVAQITSPVPDGADLALLQRLSFAQKLYLLLILAERSQRDLLSSGTPSQRFSPLNGRHLAQPPLADAKLEKAFLTFLESEGIPW